MEEKQLNFNRPLLSVRRIPSAAAAPPPPPKTEAKRTARTDATQPKLPALPFYKSELKSGPVGIQGAVPFVWERTPGNPKNDGAKRRPQSLASQQPYVAPKLPPGRALIDKQQASTKTYDAIVAGGQPHTGNALNSAVNVARSYVSVINEESSKSNDGVDDTVSAGSEEEGSSVYVDALDTLSRSESFFLNCSVSGVSGLDGSGLKPSGTILTDPESRDFMMNRFLPAAKAMASETPQHFSTKKQPVAREQPRQIKHVVTTRPVNRVRPNYTQHYAEGNGVDESEDEEDDYGGPDYSSHKLCGLLPQLCLRNSIHLLNPVTGMRKHVVVPATSVRTRKVKPANVVSSNSQAEIEHGRHATYQKRSMVGLQTTGTHEDENVPRTELNQKSLKRDYQKSDGSSLYELFQGNDALPEDNKLPQQIPEQSKTSEGYSVHSKTGRNFKESLIKKSNNRWESGSTSPVFEKTLYVDSIQIVKPQKSSLGTLNTKGSTTFEGDNFYEVCEKSKEMEENSSVRSSEENLKAVDEKAKVRHESMESMESMHSCFLSFSDRSVHDVTDGSTRDQDLLLLTGPKVGGHGLGSGTNTRSATNMANDRKTDLEGHCQILSVKEPSKGCYYSELPPPPPLPTSPTESWLLRALTSVSSKKPSSRSFLGMAASLTAEDSKTQITDLRLDTIVKTSSTEHGNSRCSGELLTTIPEI